MDFRPIDWSADHAALLGLDTSFVTDRIYRVQGAALSFALVPELCLSPFTKQYAPALSQEAVFSALVTVAASERGKLCGFGVVRDEAWNGRAVVTDFCVDSASRRRGRGRAMMDEVCRRLAETSRRMLWTETQNVNLPAIDFYRGVGFEVCGRDSTFYPDPHASEVAIFLSEII